MSRKCRKLQLRALVGRFGSQNVMVGRLDDLGGGPPPLKFFEKIFVGVGKTSLAVRFIHGTFQEVYSKTIEDTYRYISVLENQYNATLTLALFQKTLGGSQSESVK